VLLLAYCGMSGKCHGRSVPINGLKVRFGGVISRPFFIACGSLVVAFW
jgi:hypothetical protein